jgi:hypothetical protein
MSIRWSAMPGDTYAAIPPGKQIPLTDIGFIGLTDIGFIGLRPYKCAWSRPRLGPQADETVQ